MVRFRDRRRTIKTYSEKQSEKKEGFVDFGNVDRTRYPKMRVWYFIIIIFLGFLYFIAKFLLK